MQINENKCPVVEENGVKLSAYWIIGIDLIGKCERCEQGICELSGQKCFCRGKRNFEVENRRITKVIYDAHTGEKKQKRGRNARRNTDVAAAAVLA